MFFCIVDESQQWMTNLMTSCRTEMTKDEVVLDLTEKRNILFWSSIFVGSISICVLGYAIYRYRNTTLYNTILYNFLTYL